jgi:tetratricopeptide (TPR) repeat protein
MAARANLDGTDLSYPWAGFFASDATPCVASSTIETEYSFPHSSTGVGRWSSGMGADLLEERVRSLVAQKAAAADQLFADQQYKQALTLYLEACQADPEQPRIQFMVGICAWNVGRHDEAGAHLRESVRLQPDQPMAHHGLADWCVDGGDFSGALHHSARAQELAPNDPHFAVSRAAILEACGKRQEAWEQVQGLLKTPFRLPRLAALYARLAPGTGHEQVALDLIDQETRSATTTGGEHRMLRLAAAGLLDRVRHFDGAFAFANSAHACEPNPYNPGEFEQQVQRQIDYFTPAKLHDLPRSSLGSQRPVFIIGMPRSGTSLVEQILASHPEVYGAGELTTISDISNRLCGSEWNADAYPQCLDALSVRTADKHASDYLRVLHELNQSARFVTDKMPTNFLDLGVISTLFPDAHVIHCTRNALDTCISCYLTHFAIGHLHARDLSHLGAYYRHYRRLMDHWTKKLNFPVLEVRYEEVVSDVPNQARRMLDFLGLPWDDRCTAFHNTSRQVTTASRNQVNQPIYSTSVNRWRNYDKHLGPLREALGEWADA